jgi:hypothetical protein
MCQGPGCDPEAFPRHSGQLQQVREGGRIITSRERAHDDLSEI